jgi:uncharacterized protein YdeI (YjbR/CyaY-like superfamily)
MPLAPTKGFAFRTQADFATWLKKNHATKTELWMRLFKVHAKHRGIGYREALDESLCWGWIDGVRYSLDDDSFTQRFTPRQKKSIWSAVNIKRYKELLAAKLVMPTGAAAFARWGGKKAPYSFESRPRRLSHRTSRSAGRPKRPSSTRRCRRGIARGITST